MILPIWPTKSWIGALGERVETRLGLLGLPLGFIWVHLVLLVHPWFTVVSLSVHVGSTLDSLGCTCLVWCHLVSLDVTWFRVVSLGFHGLIWFGFNWFHCMVLDGRLRWYWMVLDGRPRWFHGLVPWFHGRPRCRWGLRVLATSAKLRADGHRFQNQERQATRPIPQRIDRQGDRYKLCFCFDFSNELTAFGRLLRHGLRPILVNQYLTNM